MIEQKIENVVIVGGGTAGWITASLLIKLLGKAINITLIESADIGTVGVGEATIPPIVNFNYSLGLDEKEFLKQTKGTIKLGIQFENWKEQGSSYMHAFGNIGKDFPFCGFHHFWTRANQAGFGGDYWDYSLNYQAAKANKFTKLNQIPNTQLPGLVYAYHFDASLYADYLRSFSVNIGVKRIEDTVKKVNRNVENGFIESLELKSGGQVKGDLFIDCTGQAALLIEKTLNTGFEDWSHWLPCNRAMAVQCESTDDIEPYTRSIAHDAGWQWRIPLQHRIGNGLVYSSKYMTDEQAKELLLSNLDGKVLTEPRVIPFRTGRRLKQWNKNVISIGLSSGFLEPLESTSIHLIQSAAIRLIKHFPHSGIKQAEIEEFNQQSKVEFEKIRDFIILHYKLNERHDSEFWRECQRMDIPDSLAQKMELFKQSGKVFREQDELFSPIAWQQVLIGQGAQPQDYHPLVNALNDEQLKELMNSLKTLIDKTVKKLPGHKEFLDQ